MRAPHHGLGHRFDLRAVGQFGRILDRERVAAGHRHPVLHVGDGGDELDAELAIQALLHDLQGVEQAQETAAKAEPQRARGLGLEPERGVVQPETVERIPSASS